VKTMSGKDDTGTITNDEAAIDAMVKLFEEADEDWQELFREVDRRDRVKKAVATLREFAADHGDPATRAEHEEAPQVVVGELKEFRKLAAWARAAERVMEQEGIAPERVRNELI
jgi:hypothetical protein